MEPYNQQHCLLIGQEAYLFHQDEHIRLQAEIKQREVDLDYHQRQMNNWDNFLTNVGRQALATGAEIVPFVPQQRRPERHLKLIRGEKE